MLKKTREILDTAGKLMLSRKKHMSDDNYDYYTANHCTVAVVPKGTDVSDIATFKCHNFALVDECDFR